MGVPEVGDFWEGVGVGGKVVEPESVQPIGTLAELDVVVECVEEVSEVVHSVCEYFTFFETVAD